MGCSLVVLIALSLCCVLVCFVLAALDREYVGLDDLARSYRFVCGFVFGVKFFFFKTEILFRPQAENFPPSEGHLSETSGRKKKN